MIEIRFPLNLKYDNIILGGNLESLKFAMDNFVDAPVIGTLRTFQRPSLENDAHDGKEYHEYMKLTFLLSLSGRLLFQDKCVSMILDERNNIIQLYSDFLHLANITYGKMYVFDPLPIENYVYIEKRKNVSYRIIDRYHLIIDGSTLNMQNYEDKQKIIWKYPHDKVIHEVRLYHQNYWEQIRTKLPTSEIPQNKQKTQLYCVTISNLTENEWQSNEYTESIMAIKLRAKLKNHKIKGQREVSKGKTKARHSIKIKQFNRTVQQIETTTYKPIKDLIFMKKYDKINDIDDSESYCQSLKNLVE